MKYSFDVAGTQEIGITSLKDNLLDIFNASGISLDPKIRVFAEGTSAASMKLYTVAIDRYKQRLKGA